MRTGARPFARLIDLEVKSADTIGRNAGSRPMDAGWEAGAPAETEYPLPESGAAQGSLAGSDFVFVREVRG
jgi:hypothetical protein